jgi:TonB family protein
MNRRLLIAISIVTLLVGSCVAPLALAAGDVGPGVLTEVIIEVGRPQPDQPEPAAGLVPPGVVLLVESRGGSVMERYVKIHQELRDAYRLASFDKGTKAMLDLAPGAAQKVASPIGGLDTSLKVLSTDDAKATYEVRLEEHGKEPVVTRLAVKRGEWAIVGGRDGAAAPYFFMLIRPLTVAEEQDEARWKGMTKPKVLNSVQPKYPEEARAAKEQDIIVLELEIRADGSVASASPLQGKVPSLVEAARAAALQWTFEPARDAKGQPVAVKYTITLAFKLQ